MDDLSALAGWLRQLWVVWLMLLFLGIAVWAFRPKNRERLERHGRIPLEDNDKEP